MLRTFMLRFVFIVIFASAPLSAATRTQLADDALAPLRARSATQKVIIDGLPLYDARRSVIELEEFHVWAPDAKVVLHDGSEVTYLDPPSTRFFRGLVNGDPESFAYFAVDRRSSRVDGLIVVREKKFAVGSSLRQGKVIPRRADEAGQAFDYFLTEADEADMTASTNRTWQCEVDKMEIDVPRTQLRATGTDGLPVSSHGISGSQSYAMTIEIQTDHEFFLNAESNSTTATNYVTNLVGALSTIYNRDLKTNVVLGNVNLWTTDLDPWTATSPSVGMDQLGDYYHNVFSGIGFPNTSGRTTSAVAMLSGKDVPGGIAWRGTICGEDFTQNSHWGGPYSWNGGIGLIFGQTGLGPIPDPNATTNGALYGMPTDVRSYWPLAQLAHELGHNMGSKHTHCMTLTSDEALATGRSYVDTCYNAEGSCFSGTTTTGGALTCDANGFCSPAPIERGTLMSYCHNIFGSGGVPQSRFVFGLPGEVSRHVLDDYLLRPEGPVSGFNNIVIGVGSFTISSITAPGSVASGSTGNSASISTVSGAAYNWTVTNGSITAGQGTNAITFTAGSSGTVTLRATAYNSTRCGVTDTVSVTISDATVAAPTGVVATATSASSVTVTWNAVSGATGYQVDRSAGNNVWEQIGTPTAPPFVSDVPFSNFSYLYRVRAVNGSTISANSATDYATAFVFTDSPLVAGSTFIRGYHVGQLRMTANYLRNLAGLADFAFTDPTIFVTVTPMRAVHITELRTAVNEARAALGFPALSFTDGTLTARVTGIKIAHIHELRSSVQ